MQTSLVYQDMARGSKKKASEEVYVVKRLIDQKVDSNKQIKYLIEWEGYSELTWEPEENINDRNMIEEFNKKGKKVPLSKMVLKPAEAVHDYVYDRKTAGYSLYVTMLGEDAAGQPNYESMWVRDIFFQNPQYVQEIISNLHEQRKSALSDIGFQALDALKKNPNGKSESEQLVLLVELLAHAVKSCDRKMGLELRDLAVTKRIIADYPKLVKQAFPNGIDAAIAPESSSHASPAKSSSPKKAASPAKKSKAEEQSEVAAKSAAMEVDPSNGVYDAVGILARHQNKRTKTNFYLVRWQNYSRAENTWEPESNLVKCKDIIQHYLDAVEAEDQMPYKKVTWLMYKKPVPETDQEQGLDHDLSIKTGAQIIPANVAEELEIEFRDWRKETSGKEVNSIDFESDHKGVELLSGVEGLEEVMVDFSAMCVFLPVGKKKDGKVVAYLKRVFKQ